MRNKLALSVFVVMVWLLILFCGYTSLTSQAQPQPSNPPTKGNNNHSLDKSGPVLPTNGNTNQALGKSGPQGDNSGVDSSLPRSGSDLPSSSGRNLPLPEASRDRHGYLSRYEYTLAGIVALVSVITLSMQFLLLRQIKVKAEDTLRTFGVTLIIMGSIFLIAVGFDSFQIAPVMGLFGTIAGYLLGRVERKENEKSE